MKAMVLEQIGEPLAWKEVPEPEPGPFEIKVKIGACGVCRTDLHIADGELPNPKLPLILGHQVVGVVDQLGKGASKYPIGARVGIPWLGSTCQSCEFCTTGRENLCSKALFTGYQRQGGYAQYCTVNENYALALPALYSDVEMAPLLCAGIIGYRAFKLCGPVKKIGFYGFGSSAHLLIQVATTLGCEIYVFTRPGDTQKQQFAKSLGATWAGDSNQLPPTTLDAALLFAPDGSLYISALKAIKKGGKVISAGIHMSDIPSFPYALLWGEKTISSVANLTRQDGVEWIELVEKIPLQVCTSVFPLQKANEALEAIREGLIDGSAVLEVI